MIPETTRSNAVCPEDEDVNGFVRLFVSKRLIHGLASALLGIFTPIFIYQTAGESFLFVGVFYIFTYILYSLLLIPGIQFINKIGFSHALVIGGALSVAVYSLLYFLTPENFWQLIGPISLIAVGFKIFHWVPYHVDFTIFTNQGERGSKVGLVYATTTFMGAVGPILAGFIIAEAGYDALFATSIVILIISTISYFFVPETDTRFDWIWKETWQKILSPKLRPLMLSEFSDGIEIVTTVVIWPIFLYEILAGDIFEIGAISTATVGVTVILQLLLGKRLDAKAYSRQRILKVGSHLYALGWIVKMFVLSAVQVFFVGLYHNLTKIFTKTPFTAIAYDLSAEQGRHLDEFIVIRQIAQHLGRAACLFITIILTLFVSIEWTFWIAAVASISLNVIHRFNDGKSDLSNTV